MTVINGTSGDYELLSERMKIESPVSIGSLHRHYHTLYSDIDGANTQVNEWFCLSNILLKNIQAKVIVDFQRFPFVIRKSERPDFALKFIDRIKLIEITKITTERIEQIRNHASNTSGENVIYEDDPKLYGESSPSKGEFDYLIHDIDEELVGDPTYGSFPEIRWAEICIQAILKKANKDYAVAVDYLLLDDLEYHLYGGRSVLTSYKVLKDMITASGLREFDKFPNIIANSKGCLGLIRLNWKWCCCPVQINTKARLFRTSKLSLSWRIYYCAKKYFT